LKKIEEIPIRTDRRARILKYFLPWISSSLASQAIRKPAGIDKARIINSNIFN